MISEKLLVCLAGLSYPVVIELTNYENNNTSHLYPHAPKRTWELNKA